MVKSLFLVKLFRHDASLIVLGLLLLPWLAGAGVIRLEPEARVEITNGLPVLGVQLFNTGDEPARIVSVELEGSQAATAARRTLGSGESASYTFPLPAPILPGTHQAVARIRYEDFSGVKFSSVVVAPLAWGRGQSEDDSWINVVVSPVSLGRSGPLRVSVLLLQDDPAEVTVRLVLPDEFGCSAPEQRVVLQPDTRRELTFDLANRGGLPGGVYSLVAIVGAESSNQYRSVAATGAVTVSERQWLGQSGWVWLAGALLLLAVLWGAGLFCSGRCPQRHSSWLDALLLAILSGFILWQFAPLELLRNTTAVGGDTPAHLYLMGHLSEQLFHHGRLISWAGGWWCGFPMFQYYFVLPYLSGALLGVLIPAAVAFKLVSVAGVVLTPLCAYWAARLWRLPRPVPVVLASAMVPFLFVQSHTMWGVNTASTLAGMISNSWSFALMLPALASASRDAEEGTFRVRSVVLMVLVLASHFFTSVMMFLTLAIVPVLCLRHGGVFRALRVLFREGALALLLMSWWIVPLIVKSRFSMDFGTNWAVVLWSSFPAYAAGLLVFTGVALMFTRRSLAIPLLLWMLVLGAILFQFGFGLSPVFVNVRLWPFVFFALIALAAIGLGLMVKRGGLALILLTMAVLLAVRAGDSLNGTLTGPGLTRSWAAWNYSGLESKPAAAVFEKLVMPLKGTPGRLANDLCEENNQLGSSRVFELAPYLAGKAVLEGGLVNSALGSMYAYTIQGETSDSCAGFPPIVTPQPFNFTHATRHLELFNVKHFIARGANAKAALRHNTAWRLVAQEQEWELYELMSHKGRFVFIPPRLPVVVETAHWKECSLAWLITPGANDQFAIWSDGKPHQEEATLLHLTERQYLDVLGLLKTQSASEGGSVAGTACIRDEEVTDDHIRFTTTAIGQPHIVKMSWFPNWKVRGAARVYCVSPGFMLVFPEQAQVELYYGTTWSDSVGYVLTVVGCLGLLWAIRRRGLHH